MKIMKCAVERLAEDPSNVRLVCDNGSEASSRHFHICMSSVAAIEKLARQYPEVALELLSLEDKFLSHEMRSMCHYHNTDKKTCVDRSEAMLQVSNSMKDILRRVGADPEHILGHHPMHIASTAPPTPCENIPSALMNSKAMKCEELGLIAPRRARSTQNCPPRFGLFAGFGQPGAGSIGLIVGLIIVIIALVAIIAFYSVRINKLDKLSYLQ